MKGMPVTLNTLNIIHMNNKLKNNWKNFRNLDWKRLVEKTTDPKMIELRL